MSITKIRLPDRIADADGRPTLAFLETWEQVINTASTRFGTPGKVLRDAAVAQQSADAAAAAADAANANASNTPSGAMTVTGDRASVSGSGTALETVETNAATITVTGGTAPYSAVAVKTSGDTLTETFTGLPLAADGTFTLTFSATASPLVALGSYRIDVTDSAGSPLTESVFLSASIVRTDTVLL